eukprot:2866264-Amphidinium_carterae.1
MTQQAEHQERINHCTWTREDIDVQHFVTTKIGGKVWSQAYGTGLEDQQGHQGCPGLRHTRGTTPH